MTFPYLKETMGLPRGTLRGVLTITLLFVIIIMEVASLKIPGLEDNFRELRTAFEMVIAFYFGSKVFYHVTSSDRQKTALKTDAVKATSMNTQQSDKSFNDPEAIG